MKQSNRRPAHAVMSVVIIGLLATPAGSSHGADYRKHPVWQAQNAENHFGLRFLPPSRDWERMHVYVPNGATGKALPCVVFFYGGGWGGKNPWTNDNNQKLLDSGYVVALPDYVLEAQQPVPLAIWDGAAAIRYLRANAEEFRIDPARICAVGLSAGGWLVQYLSVSDSGTQIGMRAPDKSGWYAPMVERHPADAEFSARVCAFVTDWGAGTLCEASRMAEPQAWLGPDDPPLFTCVSMPKTWLTPGVRAYREAGALAEAAHIYSYDRDGKKSFRENVIDFGHCVVGVKVDSIRTDDPQTGAEITFGERTLQFLDKYVKGSEIAGAPEIIPGGGPLFGRTNVVLRTFHKNAQILYTVNGSLPTPGGVTTRRYDQPVPVQPGTTLRAITVVPGLPMSGTATAMYTEAPCVAPVITTVQQEYKTKVGQPFSVTLKATCTEPVTWRMCGKIEAQALEKIDSNKDSSAVKQQALWLSLNPETGVLSGTPPGPGVSVLIAVAHVSAAPAVNDARRLVVVVEKP